MAGTLEINQVGKREQLLDVIETLEAPNFPAFSTIPKGEKLTNTLIEFQMDRYDDAKTGGIVDGKDVDDFEDPSEHRARTGVYPQIFRRSVKVSRLADRISNIAGASEGELARGLKKKSLELKIDIETAILSTQDTQAEVQPTTAYLLRGMGSWISATAQSTQPVPADYRTPSAQLYSSTTAAFDEEDLRDMMESRWDNSKKAVSLKGFVGSQIKSRVADFTRYESDKSGYLQVRRFNQQKSNTLETTVDIYSGDFGKIEFMLAGYLPTTHTGYIVDLDCWKIVPGYMGDVTELEDKGGGRRYLIESVLGLICTMPKGQIKIVGS